MNDTIRIAMLIQAYPLTSGGAERLLQSTVPLLCSQGMDVHIITRLHPGQLSFEVIDNIPVYRLSLPGMIPAASLIFTLKAQKLIGRLRPDILHAHELFSPTTTAVVAKFLFNIPIVATLHGGGYLGDIPVLMRRFLGKARLAIIRKNVDAFVVISREIESAIAKAGIDHKRRVFIPNGVDISRFRPIDASEKQALRLRFGLPVNALVGVFTGRLVPLKNVDHLVTIWPAVRAKYQDAVLLVLGSGPEKAILSQVAGEGVKLLGDVEDVVPYLQAADIFVLPSVAEGLSIALLEAMACGLAVIATNVGGNPEIISHNENGWLIPPNDIQTLQKAILTLFGDDETRLRLGRQATAHVKKNYNISSTANQLVSLYKALMSRRLG